MQHPGQSTSPLVGRQRELRAIADLLGPPPSGQAVNLIGDAGIGKSRLLGVAASQAGQQGWLLLSAAATRSEAPLAFAGLHQLLGPVLDRLDRLPGPQQDAISAAFGLSDRAAPDLFFVGLATLGLLGEAANDAPILALVEDGQWLDRATCDVITFVARRLAADPIVFLTSIRRGIPTPLTAAGIPELVVDGLDPTASALLLSQHGAGLPPMVRTRILDEAQGNPLALIELPEAFRRAQLHELAALPPLLPMSERLQALFARQLEALPALTRDMLLLSALETDASVTDVVGAAQVWHGTASIDDLLPAVSGGMVQLDESGMRFRHPLIRSAVHGASNLAQRQAAHAALADVFAEREDHGLWHRAAAALDTNDDLATELAELARHAQERGTMDVAVAALERAADLTTDRSLRSHHLLHAAELASDLGRVDTLQRLLGLVEARRIDVADQARSAWLHEMLAPGLPTRAARVVLLDTAERARRAGHPELAVRVLWVVAMKCWWHSIDDDEWEPVRAAVDRLTDDHPRPRLVVLRAYTTSLGDASHAADSIAAEVESEDDASGLWMLGNAASIVTDFDVASGRLARAARMLRAEGRLGHLARVLTLSAWSDAHVGNWGQARLAAQEAGRLAEETGQPVWQAAADVAGGYVAARRGETDLADALASSAERQAQPTGERFVLATVQFVRGVAVLATGSHDDAYARLRRLFDPTERAYHPATTFAAIADLAEAARHTDNLDDVAGIVATHPALHTPTSGPWIRAAMACVRPLLATTAEAESAFQASLDGELKAWPFDHARLELAFGQWLRRQRRTADSRRPLRAARDAFDALGAAPWAQRARRELRAAGEVSLPHPRPRRDHLTPQEMQVALLAADGLSNRQIAQQLFLSPRTVGSHLYRVYPKLGIASRTQLHVALTDAPAPADHER